MYRLKHFTIEELIPKQLYEPIDKEKLLALIDDRLKETLDQIQEHFGHSIIVNTWNFRRDIMLSYGEFNERGFRASDSKVGAKKSAHKLGMAADFDVWEGVRRLEPQLVRDDIIKNIAKFPFIRGIEIDVGWVHIDVLERGEKVKVCLFNANGSKISWI